ncbi:type VII secretion integral membrane protein EccD [Mycobacterium lehmannii]|uniref:type VII secretion integral membrane protein EccD n=1 Tax=Mycobacterium lehmannii TaxID=2048550 RepID=UPI000B93CD79|nr:type VII secretion integral membrane protein EccD [Mycobacterium lehmannii]
MTTVRPSTPPSGSPAPGGPLVPSSCRVSLLVGDSHQIDLVLPAAVPLSALTDSTLGTVNRLLRAKGEDELPVATYEFARAVGMTRLSDEVSLSAQGVSDGDLLAFVPQKTARRYTPLIENVSTALARWAHAHFPPVSPHDAVVVAGALTAAALAGAAVLVWRMRWAAQDVWLSPAILAGAALVLLAAAMLTARSGASRVIVDGAAWASLISFVVAGATAPYGDQPGAPHAFLAALVAAVGVLLLARMTGRHWTAAAAVVTVAVAVIGAALTRMFFDVPGQRIAIVMLMAVLIASRTSTAVGLWMSKVPRQTFESITGRDMFSRAPGQPEDTLTPVESAAHDVTLRGEEVAEVARRSNRVLTGTLLGIAAVQLASSWWAINPGAGSQWPSIVVVVVSALCLILRARGLRHRRHAVTIVSGSALSLMAIPVHYGMAAPASATGAVVVAAAAVLAVAVGGLLAGAVIPSRSFSEPIRQVVEWLEYIGYALILPFAAWAIGLLQYVRLH